MRKKRYSIWSEKALAKVWKDEKDLIVEDTNTTPTIQPIAWKGFLTDTNITINPPGFLHVRRADIRSKIAITNPILDNVANTAYGWRTKILKGNFKGFALILKIFSGTGKLVKVEQSTDRTLLSGVTSSKTDLNLLEDYHSFKLVINDEEKASLFVDGEKLFANHSMVESGTLAEESGLYFEKSDSNVSIDYFYIDIDNDGVWDYTEEWNDVNGVS